LSAVAIVTLGVAVGANTTVFSVVNSVIIQPLAYPEPDRLVRINSQFFAPGMHYERFAISPPEYLELREHTLSYQSIAAFVESGSPVTGGTEPVRVTTAVVTGPFFQTLGVEPELGRAFSAEEDRPGDPRAVVLGHGLWRRAFGGDPAILGKRTAVDGKPVTVIGVMPAGYAFPGPRTELWIPLDRDLSQGNRANHYLELVARLKRGVSLTQARAELDSFMAWQ